MKLIEDTSEPEQIDKHHVEIIDEFLTPEALKAIQAFLKVPELYPQLFFQAVDNVITIYAYKSEEE